MFSTVGRTTDSSSLSQKLTPKVFVLKGAKKSFLCKFLDKSSLHAGIVPLKMLVAFWNIYLSKYSKIRPQTFLKGTFLALDVLVSRDIYMLNGYFN